VKDQADLFCALLKASAHFVRHSPDFCGRACADFPAAIGRFALHLPFVVHLCVRRLLKWAVALYAETATVELIEFVAFHLSSADLSLQALAVQALVAFSGRPEDSYLDLVVDCGFLEMLPHLTFGPSRALACLVLRNFAASREIAVLQQITTPPVLDFLGSVADDDAFSGKQRAYAVVCYLVIAGCPEMHAFLTEKRFRDLVGVLTESAETNFLAAALLAIQIIVSDEECHSSKTSTKNGIVELLIDAGILEFLADVAPTDRTMLELRDRLSDTIEQVVIYDRL
jgi:hypothetical protein